MDSADITGRIFDHLTLHFSRDDLFKDVDSIPLGVDFRKSISDAVQACHVVLAVIGRNWLSTQDKQEHLRLSNPDDFVRIELEAGLERNIPVIPVLVSGADMPEREVLPIPLQPLVYRNAISLRPEPDFSVDIQRLIRVLTEILQRKNTAKGLLLNPHLVRSWWDVSLFVVVVLSLAYLVLDPAHETFGSISSYVSGLLELLGLLVRRISARELIFTGAILCVIGGLAFGTRQILDFIAAWRIIKRIRDLERR